MCSPCTTPCGARSSGHASTATRRCSRCAPIATGHSMSDPLHGVYRTKDEVEEQKARDPITHLAGKLKDESVMDQAALDAMDAEIHAEVEEAVKFADESPDPEPDELFTDVLVD